MSFVMSKEASPLGPCDRTWHSHSIRPCPGSRGSPPSSGSAGSPRSRVGRRSPTCRPPPGWSGSGQTWREGRRSRSCTHSDGLRSSFPRRRWSMKMERGWGSWSHSTFFFFFPNTMIHKTPPKKKQQLQDIVFNSNSNLDTNLSHAGRCGWSNFLWVLTAEGEAHLYIHYTPPNNTHTHTQPEQK